MGLKIYGIYDDAPTRPSAVLGYPVIGGIDEVPDQSDTLAVIAVGNNVARRVIASKFEKVRWAILSHPNAWVDSTARLGDGTVVMAGSVIQPSVHTGCHTIINTGASLDHDCELSDFVHVAPGSRLTGNVLLGEGVFAGAGSVFTPGIKVGQWSIIGAGASVVFDLPANVTAVGTPAKVIKQRKAEWHRI